MAYTMQEKLGISWLENVDGCTVENAIEYLKTLDKNYILSVWLEGDTHGADIECDVFKEREQTTIEKWNTTRAPLLRNLETYTKGMQYYKERGRFDNYMISARNADKYAALLVEHDKIKP